MGQDVADATQAAADKVVDAAPLMGAALGMMGLGASGTLMHAAIHKAGGAKVVSKNSHLHGQMQAGTVMAKDLSEKFGDPSILEDYRNLTRQAADAERKQMAVLADPAYLRYAQTYSHVPPEWMEALQARRAKIYTPPPGGLVSGKHFLEFERATLDLWDRNNARYNRGMKKHGQEGISPEMGPLHPRGVSSWGTESAWKRIGSELVSGAKNAWREARHGSAKGFTKPEIEQLRADYGETLNNELRTDDGTYYISESQRMPHFNRQGSDAPRVRKDGNKYVLLNEDGSPVQTPSQVDAWIEGEQSRFVRNVDEFKNTAGDAGVFEKHDDYKRKLPYLRNAHKATFQDLMSELMGMDSKAAALEAHSPDIEGQVTSLRSKISRAGNSSIGDDKAAGGLNEFLGGEGNAKGASSLFGRMMQQQGRLSSGGGGNGLLARGGRVVAAMAPFSYRYGLSINQNPVAAQQVQAAAMNLAFANQDPAMLGRLAKNYGKVWLENLDGLRTGQPGDLAIPHNKMRFDRLGIESFEKSNAMWNEAITRDMEARTGSALRTGDDSWLDMMYTPEQKAFLRRRLRADGTVDLSDPDAKLLANSVLGRHLEGINGMDLPTSKPAAFYIDAAKPFTMYMATPAIVAKSVTDLYRPGGMLHTGNPKLDMQGRIAVTAALATQFAGSNMVRSSALAKALSLLSAGGWAPAVTQGLAYAQDYSSGSEVTNKQQQELMAAAVTRLVNGESDPEEWASDVIKLAGAGVTGSVPLKVIGSSGVIGSLGGKIDERVMGLPGEVRQQPGIEGAIRSASQIIPALGPWVNLGFGVRDYLHPDRQYLNGGLAALFTRGVSPLPYFNQLSPIVPDVKSYMELKKKEAEKFGNVKTKRISPKVGR